MQVKNSTYGIDTKEVYVNGAYCGLCHVNQIEELRALERSLRNSKRLISNLYAVMTRSRSRPLGGFAGETELKAWFSRYGYFPCHVWVDPSRGVLWSPVAWSLTMVLTPRDLKRA